MAKRFFDTEFFKKPFVRSLEAPLKTLYCFIICDCDNAGIWSPDFEIASIYIGQKVTKKDFTQAFKTKFIELENGQWFFPDFIEHQYPKGLQENNPAHKKAIQRLKEYKLINESLELLQRPSKEPTKGSKDMEEEEVMDKVMVIGKEEVEEEEEQVEMLIYPTFVEFWELYDLKKGKEESEKKWNKLSQKTKEEIMLYLPEYIKSTPDKQYRRIPVTFLNKETWNDEIIKSNNNGQTAQQRRAEVIDETTKYIEDNYGGEVKD